jgi:Flp pilus assembly protein TadD
VERVAREVSASNPKEPEWAATYAYALHLAGKDAEAEKVMGNLPPETLARPGIALYQAIVLAANGDKTGAREYMAKFNSGGMLPEEQKMAADLRRQLNTPDH